MKKIITDPEEKINYETALTMAKEEIGKMKIHEKQHLDGLKRIMFIVSHKVRQPVANIIGIVNLLDNASKSETKKMLQFIKESAVSLDNFTKEISKFIYECFVEIKNRNMK